MSTQPGDLEAADLPAGLARSQQARQRRILDVVIELAADGGEDAVQMRVVANRADVALRTVYNYYGSRENLLHEAIIDWRRELFEGSASQLSGTTPEARMLSFLRPVFDLFAKYPKLFDILLRTTEDPWAEGIGPFARAMDEALGDIDPVLSSDMHLVLRRVVQATVASAAQGRLPMDCVWGEIEATVRLLGAALPTAPR